MSEAPIRVLIVDDHAIVREGLRMLLRFDTCFEVIGEASNGLEAVALSAELQPDVVLMDLSMPVLDGVKATERIKELHPHIEVVALTSVLEEQSVVGAVRAGAIGYVLKDTRSEVLRAAIKSAAAGQVHLAPEAASRLVREMSSPSANEELTSREFEVLTMLAQGLANKEIAQALHLGEETVKSHVSRIFAKLGVKSRTQAAVTAWQRGWVIRGTSAP